MLLGLSFCYMLLDVADPRPPGTEPPAPRSTLTGKDWAKEKEKDRLFLHPQWDW